MQLGSFDGITKLVNIYFLTNQIMIKVGVDSKKGPSSVDVDLKSLAPVQFHPIAPLTSSESTPLGGRQSLSVVFLLI